LPFTHHLDYVSCLLTILSTVLVGRGRWQGWVVAGMNSLLVSLIGMRTSQWGFIPANLFCIVIYLYNIRRWRMAGDMAGDEVETASLSTLRPTYHCDHLEADEVRLSA
jgi:hypothetical protein